MKSLFLALTLLSAAAFAQNNDATAVGGIIVRTPGSPSRSLTVPGSPVTQLITPSGPMPVTGTMSFVTPLLTSGTIANGGVFGAGGTFSLSIPSQSINISATFDAGAKWQLVTLANGTHYYLILANLTDTSSNPVQLVLTTGNTGKLLFDLGATVQPTDISF